VAHPLGEDHEAAVQWAADLARSLDRRDKATLEASWNGPEGRQHRDQLKRTGVPMLEQLAAHVRERVREYPAAEAMPS
jgi:hypothetical protein